MNYRSLFILALLAMAMMSLWQATMNTLPAIGEILAVDRSEDSTEIRAVITAKNAQIKLFFIKSIPYQSPARIDVFARDTTGATLPSTPKAVLESLPDSLFQIYNLPYRHGNELE